MAMRILSVIILTLIFCAFVRVETTVADTATFSSAANCGYLDEQKLHPDFPRMSRTFNAGPVAISGKLAGNEEAVGEVFCHIPSEDENGRHYKKLKLVYAIGEGEICDIKVCMRTDERTARQCGSSKDMPETRQTEVVQVRKPSDFEIGTSIVPPAIFLQFKFCGRVSSFSHYVVVWED